VDQFLLSTVLTNCYLLSLYGNWEGERQVKHKSQDDFKLKLVKALLRERTDQAGRRSTNHGSIQYRYLDRKVSIQDRFRIDPGFDPRPKYLI
jgi:hypothetical protein